MQELLQHREILSLPSPDGQLSLVATSFLEPLQSARDSGVTALVVHECGQCISGYLRYRDATFASNLIEDVASIELAVLLAIDAAPASTRVSAFECKARSKGNDVALELLKDDETVWATTMRLTEIGGLLLQARADLIFLQQELPTGWWSYPLDRLLRRQLI